MRRADRLFQIIQSLRGRRRAVTAAELAEDLGVSDRTIYRDIRDLVATGTPIEGEAGVGYARKREYDLPPLMFDPDELEALALGARIASSFGDEGLGRAADSALSKIEAVLPPRLRARLVESPLYAPRTGAGREVTAGGRRSNRVYVCARRQRPHHAPDRSQRQGHRFRI